MNGVAVVVVDASLAFKWLVEERDSDKAHAILQYWDSLDLGLAAPCLMPFEVTNAVHRRVTQSEISAGEGARLIERLLSTGFELHETVGLHRRALELAGQLRQGTAYDAHYLALAETLGCELWTADERFLRAARPLANNVRLLSDFVAPG